MSIETKYTDGEIERVFEGMGAKKRKKAQWDPTVKVSAEQEYVIKSGGIKEIGTLSIPTEAEDLPLPNKKLKPLPINIQLDLITEKLQEIDDRLAKLEEG